jgi:hypothetical protein
MLMSLMVLATPVALIVISARFLRLVVFTDSEIIGVCTPIPLFFVFFIWLIIVSLLVILP